MASPEQDRSHEGPAGAQRPRSGETGGPGQSAGGGGASVEPGPREAREARGAGESGDDDGLETQDSFDLGVPRAPAREAPPAGGRKRGDPRERPEKREGPEPREARSVPPAGEEPSPAPAEAAAERGRGDREDPYGTRPAAAVSPRSPPSPPQSPGRSPSPSPPEPAGPGFASWKGTRLELLGKGGFGEVWKVRYLNSEEAWKYLPKKPGGDLQALREAFNARSIDHPNVVRVLDILEDEAHYILRLDLVRGRDLHQTVRHEGVLAPETACRVGLQVADALAAAHRAGVVHLDLKPSNLILKNDGETVLITDFGISSTLREGKVQVPGGKIAGTLYFLAPEQVEAIDSPSPAFGPPTDIWAFGITLYYLLSRTYPFPFRKKDVTCILHDPPRPLPTVLPYIDGELWAILEAMLRRDPRERPPAARLRAELFAYLEEIACPACRKSYPVAAVQAACPDPACSRPDAVVTLKALRQAMRRGDEHFACCRFGEARDSYREAADREGDPAGAFTSRAVRLIEIAALTHKEHEARVAAARGLFGRGARLAALEEIDRARERFSRSPELRELRLEVLEAIHARYRAADSEKTRLVRERRFAEATALLEEVEACLEYAPAAEEIRRREEATGRRLVSLVDFFAYVKDRQRYYNQMREKLEKHLAALELAPAADCLQRLLAHFPDPEDAGRVHLFYGLQESLDIARACRAEALLEWLEADEEHLPRERIDLESARRHCDRVLASLSVESSPRLPELCAQREAIERAIALVRERARRAREDLERAERAGDLRLEAACLERLVQLADLTDLLSAEEAARVGSRHRRLKRQLERAAEKYREGEQLLESRRYLPAQTAFEAAETAAPGAFPDVQEKIRQCQEQIEANRQLGDRLVQLYNHLMSGEPAGVEDFREYFRLLSRFEEDSRDDTLVDLKERAPAAYARLLDCQRARVAGLQHARERLAGVMETADVLLESRDRFVRCLRAKSTEVNECLLGFLREALLPVAEGESLYRGGGEGLAQLQGLVHELVRLRPFLIHLAPQGPAPHPAAALSRCIRIASVPLGLRPELRPQLETLLGLHRRLLDLTGPGEAGGEIRRNHWFLQYVYQAARWRQILRLLLRHAWWPALVVLAAAGAWLVASLAYRNAVPESRERIARGLFTARGGVPEADELQRARASDDGFLEVVGALFEPPRTEGMPPTAGGPEPENLPYPEPPPELPDPSPPPAPEGHSESFERFTKLLEERLEALVGESEDLTRAGAALERFEELLGTALRAAELLAVAEGSPSGGRPDERLERWARLREEARAVRRGLEEAPFAVPSLDGGRSPLLQRLACRAWLGGLMTGLARAVRGLRGGEISPGDFEDRLHGWSRALAEARRAGAARAIEPCRRPGGAAALEAALLEEALGILRAAE